MTNEQKTNNRIANRRNFHGYTLFAFIVVGGVACKYYDCLWIIFAIIAGYANACMDIVTHKYDRSLFSLLGKPQYFNPAISWTNKYELSGGSVTSRRKTYLGFIPVPVLLTDFWHGMKAVMLLFMTLSGIVYAFNPIYTTDNILVDIAIGVFAVRFVFGLSFNFYYKLILRF